MGFKLWYFFKNVISLEFLILKLIKSISALWAQRLKMKFLNKENENVKNKKVKNVIEILGMLYHSRSFHKESFNDNHYLWKHQLFFMNADQVLIKMSIGQT